MQGLNFTALDFELANAAFTSACSLGVARVVDGEVVESRHWLIRPEPYEMGHIQHRIHGISLGELADRPGFGALWPEVAPYIEGQVLVMHNSSFDLGVLRKLCEHYGMDPEYQYDFCTYRAAPSCWPDLVDHKLSTLCKHLGIELAHHHAGSDATGCAQVAVAIARQLGTIALHQVQQERRAATSETRKAHNRAFFAKQNSVQLVDIALDWTPIDPATWSWEGKRVLITGSFEQWPERNTLAERLKARGARLIQQPNKTMDVLIVGQDAGPSKLAKVHQLLSEGSPMLLFREEELTGLVDL